MDFDFHEKQYLGYNRFGIIRRTVIVLFCLGIYYFNGENGPDRNVFFLLAIVVLVLSMVSLLIKHLDTKISGSELTLLGPMTHKRVELDLIGTKNIEITPFSPFLLNRPIFNLHRKETLRFFTHGKWSVEFTTSEGKVVRLGTQRPFVLKQAIETASSHSGSIDTTL